jgi:hypothetical protein
MELRCSSKMHGRLIEGGLFEVSCGSAFCGKKPGVVVLHRFDITTGKLVETKRFKDTPNINKRNRRVA